MSIGAELSCPGDLEDPPCGYHTAWVLGNVLCPITWSLLFDKAVCCFLVFWLLFWVLGMEARALQMLLTHYYLLG